MNAIFFLEDNLIKLVIPSPVSGIIIESFFPTFFVLIIQLKPSSYEHYTPIPSTRITLELNTPWNLCNIKKKNKKNKQTNWLFWSIILVFRKNISAVFPPEVLRNFLYKNFSVTTSSLHPESITNVTHHIFLLSTLN